MINIRQSKSRLEEKTVKKRRRQFLPSTVACSPPSGLGQQGADWPTCDHDIDANTVACSCKHAHFGLVRGIP